MAFSLNLIDPVRRVASQNGIEPAAMLAVVEIECGGQPFEADGRTPRFLFERHVFHRQLAKNAPERLPGAIRDGLAIPKWSRTTQYRDLGSSAGRQRVLAAARAIHAESANQSCSWGVGQVMGFHAGALGYGTATAMVAALTTGGLDAQIDCVVRFVRSKGLIAMLNAHDWAGFARGYNGPAYAENAYDTRLAEAYARWKRKLNPGQASPDAEDDDIPLGRTPVQNAEPRNPWTTPEGVATGVGAATGAGAAISNAETDGPIGYALAFVIVAAFCVGAFFFIKRMKERP